MRMFPKLLLLMENKLQESEESWPHTLISHFHEKMASVPIWSLLPWSNQLLGLLQSKEIVALMVKPLVLKMAEEYPQGNPVNFEYKKHCTHSNLDIANKSVRPFLFTISNYSLYMLSKSSK